jgi:Zn finger protein HypA/HybF involved in hydrogenase expression
MNEFECEICGQRMTEAEHQFSDMCPDCLEGV